MTADLSFSVAKRRREPITFDLEGDSHVYVFKPPKQARVIMPLLGGNASSDGGINSMDLDAARAMIDWLDAGLSDEDNKRIEERLRDEDDDLDFESLGDVVSGLMENVTGRPTTSQSG